jgi:hypothetical protein
MNLRNVSLQIGKIAFTGLLSLYMMPSAQAQSTDPEPAASPSSPTPDVFQECVTQAKSASQNVNGAGRLTKAGWEQVHACVEPQRKAAWTACKSQTAVSKHECMASKGFAHHRHHGPRGSEPAQGQSGETPNNS